MSTVLSATFCLCAVLAVTQTEAPKPVIRPLHKKSDFLIFFLHLCGRKKKQIIIINSDKVHFEGDYGPCCKTFLYKVC